jgi:hypothetical protein
LFGKLRRWFPFYAAMITFNAPVSAARPNTS